MKILYKPIIIHKDGSADKLFKENPDLIFIDAYINQIRELFLIDKTQFIGKKKESIYKGSDFKKFLHLQRSNYVYVYYPWIKILVKTVNKEEYFELITNRNQDLITKEEQKRLYEYRIAVFGMSVGSNIAFTLTQSGISKKIIIADLDELDTSNLNRIPAGLHQVGLEKTIIAARKIYEFNPFVQVTVLRKGISENLLQDYLQKKMIDCIIEEIDDMDMKIKVRKLAMKYRVPVLMITDNGDRIVLTVERYDLGYKKILEKTVKYWEKRISKCKSPQNFADIVINDMVGGSSKVDPRMLDSVEKVITKKFVSWPQLGTAALLGSVAATVAIKDIVRGKNKKLFIRKYLRV